MIGVMAAVKAYKSLEKAFWTVGGIQIDTLTIYLSNILKIVAITAN